MKTTVNRKQRIACLGVVCLGLSLTPLSAQEILPTTLGGHAEAVYSVAFSPNGKTLASGSADRTIKLWDVPAGKEQATLKGHTGWVMSLAFSPDGKTLASGSKDATIKLWDVKTGKALAT